MYTFTISITVHTKGLRATIYKDGSFYGAMEHTDKYTLYVFVAGYIPSIHTDDIKLPSEL